MAAELLGVGACPVPGCGSKKARVTLSKSGLACLTCLGCQAQIFARSERSDAGLRSCIIPADAPPAAPEVKGGVLEGEPAPSPKVPAKQKAERKADAWDPFV